ncbi:8-oxo-dGTP pyrophosphatase MutT (NUDIX family) [Nocardioides zeae]|uniref:8-oxo-dGTP pyrophosphatase MutT (NUDIX family) n=1 Tax=Nocardioides zeae TaxID=1457234 RepID=A0ACC6IGM5_9ACTN|nr:8-oxo-dGTP pyrophosphatase MutT (NUDIX family) [Nocardioides zeae]MDR6209898.1 8-oxo-dGTP pyrophosphatase MutT (NUDIX family) [Nocardioides zeae]
MASVSAAPAPVSVTTLSPGVAHVTWGSSVTDEGWSAAVGLVRAAVEAALVDHARVEARVRADDSLGQRVATWSGMRREGVLRGIPLPEGPVDHVLYARLADDVPADAPEGFRALLNSFLPRKRAIGQMLVRDREGRVLLCQLTYKRDWDLPGGVVEVNESPQLATAREVREELALEIPAGRLLLTDWLPPWSGWDDAVTLVFDGGVHDGEDLVSRIVKEEKEIKGIAFCTPEEVLERCADFTARRVVAALENLGGGAPAYTESGRHGADAPEG